MKKCLVSVLLVVCMFKSFSQCVSIEFSIEWKEATGKNHEKYDLSCYPYLNITYRNNTVSPLYFLKISNVEHNRFPPLEGGKTYVDTFDDLNKLNGFSNNKYNVFIGGPPFLLLDWEILSYTASIEVEHTLDPINDLLSNVYENILGNSIYQHTSAPIITEYSAKDLTEDSIFIKLHDHFVFLKAGEKHTDSFNLIGFQMVGGDYCFMVKPDSLCNFVYTDSFWDKNQAKWEYRMTPLPIKVKEYNLFSGIINTNNVSVRFTRPHMK